MPKRVRVTVRTRNVRRRLNFSAKKKRRRTKTSASWTMQTGTGKGFRPRSRKLKPRTMRRMLWRDTLFKTHWKSAASSTNTLGTGTTQAVGPLNEIFPLFGDPVTPSNDPFWTAAGGLSQKDAGSNPPLFSHGNLVIRGGQVGINFNCLDAVTNEVVVRMWVVRTTKQPSTGSLPSLPYGVQLQSIADFTPHYGRVLDYKEATLNGDYPSFTYVRRMPVQKIDMETFETEKGSQIVFVIAACNMQTADNVNIGVVTWHDMSFCGDVEDPGT